MATPPPLRSQRYIALYISFVTGDSVKGWLSSNRFGPMHACRDWPKIDPEPEITEAGGRVIRRFSHSCTY